MNTVHHTVISQVAEPIITNKSIAILYQRELDIPILCPYDCCSMCKTWIHCYRNLPVEPYEEMVCHLWKQTDSYCTYVTVIVNGSEEKESLVVCNLWCTEYLTSKANWNEFLKKYIVLWCSQWLI